MRLLIADDNVPFGRSLQELLRLWGYDPLLVHDGAAALRALRAPSGPRLALLDWDMPGVDGISVCRAVRAAGGPPYPYLLLLTGAGGRQRMLDGLAAGADDFLAKPVDAPELQARLNAGRRVVDLQARLLDAQRRLRRRARRDALTGLCNRAAVLAGLGRELERGRREGRPVGVILADVDHFKRINDTHGHPAGDRVLRRVARRMARALRPYDRVGRYGGEEFLAVLPGCDAATAARLAERLRRGVAARAVPLEDRAVPVTLSLGVATYPGAGAVSASRLLAAADAALYRAKAAGRDRVEVAAEAVPPARWRTDTAADGAGLPIPAGFR